MTSCLYIRIPVKTSMPELRVWFYDPSYDSEGVFNRLVASLDGPFCHVELQFADACACSIYMGSEVTMKIRTDEQPGPVQHDPDVVVCDVVSCHQRPRQNVLQQACC